MEEEIGPAVASADAKEGLASRRGSGIANMWPFAQRQSMDADDHPRSSDRPRKAGMGGKVKPGFGGKHRHTASGDLSTGEPASPLSCSAADSPSAAWASSSYPPAEVTDTLSLSQHSPAPVSTGKGKGNGGFFKGFTQFSKKRNSSKGSASPGVPSSPTLPGATPVHAGSMSFSASGSSLSGAGGSQSPSDSLCPGGAGASHHAGSKLGQYGSSNDPDEAEFGSCCSDAMHSPSYAQEAMYGGDTLDLGHVSYGMPADASPMATMRKELPEVFTPGFNQLMDQDCNVAREPDTPLDNTALLEPTVALLSTAQLSQVAQMYDVQSMLLGPKAGADDEAATAQASSTAAAAPAAAKEAPAAESSSGAQTLLEMEDVAAVAATEEPVAQHPAAPAVEQIGTSPVAAEDISVVVADEAAPAPEAAAAAVPEAAEAANTMAHSVAAAAVAAGAAVDESQAADHAASPAAAEAICAPEQAEAAPPAAHAPNEQLASDDAVSDMAADPPAAAAAEKCTPEAAVTADTADTEAVAVPPAAPAEEQAAAAVAEAPCSPVAAAAAAEPAEAEPEPAAATADQVVEEAAQPAAACPEEAACISPATEPLQADAGADAQQDSSAAAASAAATYGASSSEAPTYTQIDEQPLPRPQAAATADTEQPAAHDETCPEAAACTSPVTEPLQAAAGGDVQCDSPSAASAPASSQCASSSEAPTYTQIDEQPLPRPQAAADAKADADAAADAHADADTAAEVAAADCADVTPAIAGAVADSPQQQQKEEEEEAKEKEAKEQEEVEEAGVATGSTYAPSYAQIDEQPLPRPQPVADAEASSRSAADYGAGSTDVASHAIAVVNSELSMAEVSSSMVAQSSEQQIERSGSPQQQQQQGQEQPAEPLEQQPEAYAAQEDVPSSKSVTPEQADTVAAAAAETGGTEQPAAEQECAAEAQPEALQQLQEAPEASQSALSAEGSSVALPLPADDLDLEAEYADGPPLVPEASEEPAGLLSAEDDDLLLQPSSPTGTSVSSAAAMYSSPIISHPRSTGRRSGRPPVSMVRESIPLFLADPNRAVGGALMVEDSLDDQDMQQLVGGSHLLAAQAAALAAAGGAAGAAAASTRLLAHGGPQRVALGGFSGSQLNPLTTVAEGFVTSPIPEETSTGGSSQSRSSSRYEAAAAAGSPGTSPVRQLTLAAQGASPRLGTTPGSVYSTPTLTLGQAGNMGTRTQLGATPASAMSSAVGSAIRDIGSVSCMGSVDRNLSPAMPAGMNCSPTLQLLPNLGGRSSLGGGASGDGSTPSLLDARAASPSAVYNSLFTTTPFRGALAALPIDAAVNAPLVDSSPFDLTDDGFDKCGLAEEAQRVAQNLAAAAAGYGTTPFPSRTPAPNMQRPLSPGGTGLRAQLVERMASPELTDGLNQMHNQMLIKQLTAAEKRVKELEGENMRLKEQVDIYEFEKTELNSQEEMEKQARLYAESELQKAKMDNQALQKAKMDKEAEMQATKHKWQELLGEAQRAHQQEKDLNMALQQQLDQMQGERNQALDRINLLDMELTAVRGNAAGLQMALQKEQQHGADLEATVAAKDKELADMTRINNELRGKLEKAMEQLIAAQTAKEHAREKAHEESAKAVQYYNECQQMGAVRQQLLGERQQLLAAAEKRNGDWQQLKAKYIQKSSTLKEVEQKLQAKEAEVNELMAMCDQLLQQQEARGG